MGPSAACRRFSFSAIPGCRRLHYPARVRRHAERVRELVASVVRTQIKDPRLAGVTITLPGATAYP